MADAQDLSDVIVENAQGPQFAQNEMGSMRAQPLPDVVEADRYLAGKTAIKSRSRGILLTPLRPPGAV